MGSVDVRTILCGNSEVSKRNGATGKPVAVAEGREGGPITLDLTKWAFNKADCRTRCRKLIEHSKPLLLIGSPIDSGGGRCRLRRRGRHLKPPPLAKRSLEQETEMTDATVEQQSKYLKPRTAVAAPAVKAQPAL